MKRIVPALLAALLMMLGAHEAKAAFLSGFLAQCTAVGTGTCTEQTTTGYARQPIAFSNVGSGGVISQEVPYAFAQTVSGAIAGHAVYDALTGGNLLMVIPYAASYTIPSGGDHADVGTIKITVPAAAGYGPGAYQGYYQSGSTIGTSVLDGATVSSGIGIWIRNGAGSPGYGDNDFATRQVTQTTGFTYATPTGVTSVNIKGGGTLATGTVTLPVPLADGSMFKLSCSVTVTTLTVNPGAGATIVGTAPTTCGANASHALEYFAGDATWHVLF